MTESISSFVSVPFVPFVVNPVVFVASVTSIRMSIRMSLTLTDERSILFAIGLLSRRRAMDTPPG